MSNEFEADAIHTDSTTLGGLVTVTLEVTVDRGGTSFSVFLPSVEVRTARAVEFNTIGIYKEVRGQVIVAKQIVSWRTIQKHKRRSRDFG